MSDLIPPVSSCSLSTRLHLAVERFQRATHSHSVEGSTAVGGDEIDYNDYDAFVEARDAAAAQITQSNRPKDEANSAQSQVIAQPLTSPVLPLPSSTSPSRYPSNLIAQFGKPRPPASIHAANRRLYYLRHRLLGIEVGGEGQHRDTKEHGDTSDDSSQLLTYFDDAEMEHRRPALYHEYVGRFLPRDEEDEEDVKRRRRKDADDGDILMNESDSTLIESKSNLPLPSSSNRHRRELDSAGAAAHLPESLSQLLLSNYDRAQLKARREMPNGDRSANGVLPVLSNGSNQRRSSSSRPSSDLASDESELDDDDDLLSSGMPPRRRPLVEFHADDGVVLAPDGSDLREAGPTASREYAEWAREMVEDDMELKEKKGRQVEEATATLIEQDTQNDKTQVENVTSATCDPSHSPPALISSKYDDTAYLREEFLRFMQQLFLDGYDHEFVDYDRIDSDEGNEDMRERERTEQEAYFDKMEEE